MEQNSELQAMGTQIINSGLCRACVYLSTLCLELEGRDWSMINAGRRVSNASQQISIVTNALYCHSVAAGYGEIFIRNAANADAFQLLAVLSFLNTHIGTGEHAAAENHMHNTVVHILFSPQPVGLEVYTNGFC